MNAVSNTSTAVWMDRIAAIDGGSGVLGLADHLNAAVAQSQQSGQPVVSSSSSTTCPIATARRSLRMASYSIAQNGLTRYKTEYINPHRARSSATRRTRTCASWRSSSRTRSRTW